MLGCRRWCQNDVTVTADALIRTLAVVVRDDTHDVDKQDQRLAPDGYVLRVCSRSLGALADLGGNCFHKRHGERRKPVTGHDL